MCTLRSWPVPLVTLVTVAGGVLVCLAVCEVAHALTWGQIEAPVLCDSRRRLRWVQTGVTMKLRA